MTRQNLLRLFLAQSKNPDKDCDCQPTWLSLALAILPAVLLVLIDKIGDLLMRWLFGEDEEESTEDHKEEAEEEEEEAKPKKTKRSKQ